MATAGARYKLDDKAKATLRPALERFYISGIGAPPRLYHVAPPLPATWPSLGTRVLISLWDSLMFGRVPKSGALAR